MASCHLYGFTAWFTGQQGPQSCTSTGMTGIDLGLFSPDCLASIVWIGAMNPKMFGSLGRESGPKVLPPKMTSLNLFEAKDAILTIHLIPCNHKLVHVLDKKQQTPLRKKLHCHGWQLSTFSAGLVCTGEVRDFL